MALLDRINLDPMVRSGRPCIRGTRISVGDRDLLDYHLRRGGSLAVGVGARAAERATKALQKLERSR